jgi:hypothetical protein
VRVGDEVLGEERLDEERSEERGHCCDEAPSAARQRGRARCRRRSERESAAQMRLGQSECGVCETSSREDVELKQAACAPQVCISRRPGRARLFTRGASRAQEPSDSEKHTPHTAAHTRLVAALRGGAEPAMPRPHSPHPQQRPERGHASTLREGSQGAGRSAA